MLVGSTLDKYAILEEVGHGGMAVVYRAQDTVLQREVAIKVLHAHLANREESRLRLEREAIAVAKLRHDNILEIYDYSGPNQRERFIVTEFIHGPTLKEWIDEGHPSRPAIAALIGYRLCCALAHAHRTGIVHRDIKPENVMIRSCDGCLKLMDFGIAQILDNQKLTLTGQLIGSPAYMAPELIGGRPLDARTDLFAVGILLYQLATQRLPFDGRNPHEVLNRIAEGLYTPPSTHDPRIDSDLEAIIERALAVEPDDRYQTADGFAAELEEYLAELGIEAATADLAEYFLAPERFVDDLDEHVVEALVTRAHEAMGQGNRSRSFTLLARALEFHPDHAEAHALLQRLRARAARNRRVTVALASVATVAIVATGSLVWSRHQPEPLPTAQIMSQQRVAKAPAPNTVTEVETRRAPSSGMTDNTSEPPTPPPAAAASETSGASVAPADPQPEPNLTEEAEREPKRPRRRLRRPARDRIGRIDAAREMTDCRITLDNVAHTTARNFALKVGSRSVPITKLPMTVRFPGEQTTVVLAERAWKARHTLTRDACKGDGIVHVPVRAEPAEIEFENPPPGLVIVCTRGCAPRDLGRNKTHLAPIPIPSGDNSVIVEFDLHAEGYQRRSYRRHLVPGINPFPVDLEPNPS